MSEAPGHAASPKPFVVTEGPGSPDEPVGDPSGGSVKLGQVCACGASFLVWLDHYDAGKPFACPRCGATMRGGAVATGHGGP